MFNLILMLMNNEEIKLLRENNAMLKQILAILQQQTYNATQREFAVNVLANLTADGIQNIR